MKTLSKLALVLFLSPLAFAAHTTSLTWNESQSVTGFNVYRGTTPGGPYTNIGNATVLSFVDSSSALTDGSVFYYVVTALNNGAESGYSNEVKVSVPYVAPPAPTGLTGTAK